MICFVFFLAKPTKALDTTTLYPGGESSFNEFLENLLPKIQPPTPIACNASHSQDGFITEGVPNLFR